MELKADLMAHPDPGRWGIEVVASAMPLHPVIDGDVIPAAPLERIRAGSAGGVDVIAGTNVDDWRLFLAASGAIGQITDRILTGNVAEYGYQSVAAYGLPVERALTAYRAAYPSATPGNLCINHGRKIARVKPLDEWQGLTYEDKQLPWRDEEVWQSLRRLHLKQ